ncbi:ribosome small subunit-dependent GTPase A [Haloimpatiens sp. FM7315]|uniref:ribosome small subunit-dependent GTPase A n=1 Tax=Haloimpatiens sp. FM7315 TaxID=3298609 RepID=UPI00370B1C88
MKLIKINLKEYGLKASTLKEFESLYKNFYLGRVVCQLKSYYKVITEKGIMNAKIPGKIMYNTTYIDDFPTVGDFVVLDRDDDLKGDGVIKAVLKRYSKFSRKISGNKEDEQIIAANIDILFITMSLNDNFNLRRLERYVASALESGAKPVVLLTKADLCDNVSEKSLEVSKVTMGIDTLVISSFNNKGISEVLKRIPKGCTVAFVGSSGVGKSTLINKLLGYEKMKISKIREADGRGRHTTTYRELIKIPELGVVIDTPGMREFHLMDVVYGVENAFSDIETLALNCKFRNCSHSSELGCAVKKAIEEGVISEARYKNYIKLLKEAEFMHKKEKSRKLKSERGKKAFDC